MAPEPRIVVSRTVPGGARGNDGLRLLMLGCEEAPPYGPPAATAAMFLELLCAAHERHRLLTGSGADDGEEAEGAHQPESAFAISITVYHARADDYPQSSAEWDAFDGIIIPGSLSAAYDTHVAWIRRLHDVIQTEICEKRRKALGVCFGHQCLAHSFGMAPGASASSGGAGRTSGAERRGSASKCSLGPMAGRRRLPLTDEGRLFLGRRNGAEDEECVEMLFTRGDMVQSLPPGAVSLCGTAALPCEACAYFASAEEVEKFRGIVKRQKENGGSGEGPHSRRRTMMVDDRSVPRPYAVTFQSHPEYVTRTGYRGQFARCVAAMEESGAVDDAARRGALADADANYDALERDSLDAVVAAARILGWFQP
ncbi:hypothetical protein ACHAXT_003435 [Thalassiosira profunda]